MQLNASSCAIVQSLILGCFGILDDVSRIRCCSNPIEKLSGLILDCEVSLIHQIELLLYGGLEVMIFYLYQYYSLLSCICMSLGFLEGSRMFVL